MDHWPDVDRVLWRARESAFPPGEFVGQESLVSASEIRWLGERAGLREGVSVLDLCCGVSGPGLLLVEEFGCGYLGVDADGGSIDRARLRAAEAGLSAQFEVVSVPPVPTGTFDVVLLLETFLAFRDKGVLLHEVASALPVGGRFAFTVEEGRALSPEERAVMPGGDTVWLTPLASLRPDLERAGFEVRWMADRSQAHRVVVDALADAYQGCGAGIHGLRGAELISQLVTSHRLWSRWLGLGRVRKFVVVAEKMWA
ncbi:class I SAM-dependent methyltransferase [Knoellia sp. S7-12]|uniref:SAM-dependent methyltransferase n=1 Tax=Knoellia sp. S7-12 TaxID=3126698 RepID=UPI0033685F63